MSKYREGFFDYLEFSDDPDAPSGAWQAMIEDSVTFYNNEYGTDYDTHDAFMDYIEWKANKQQNK